MTESEIVKSFLAKHHLDWFHDIGGCETCGPEYEWNCTCGASGSGSDGFGDHQMEMAESWIGEGPDITREDWSG